MQARNVLERSRARFRLAKMFVLCSHCPAATQASDSTIREPPLGGFKRQQISDDEGRRAATSLGELAEAGLKVFCWCNRCGHNAEVPIETLVAQLGPAFPVPEVGARMRCSGCGSKDIATRPAWPGLGQVARHD